MRFAVIACASTLVGVLASCGSSSVSTPTSFAPQTPAASPTISAAEYEQQYLTIVAPYNAALTAFNVHMKPYDGTANYPSETDLQSWCTPFAAAVTDFDNLLLRSPWPPDAVADIHALATADAPELADLNNCGSPNELTWFTQFDKDDQSSSTAANVVRADLGLPPPPSDTP